MSTINELVINTSADVSAIKADVAVLKSQMRFLGIIAGACLTGVVGTVLLIVRIILK